MPLDSCDVNSVLGLGLICPAVVQYIHRLKASKSLFYAFTPPHYSGSVGNRTALTLESRLVQEHSRTKYLKFVGLNTVVSAKWVTRSYPLIPALALHATRCCRSASRELLDFRRRPSNASSAERRKKEGR